MSNTAGNNGGEVAITKKSNISNKPAGADFVSRSNKREINFVRIDGIMKEIVSTEQKSHKAWELKYGSTKEFNAAYEKEMRETGFLGNHKAHNRRRPLVNFPIILENFNPEDVKLSRDVPKTSSGMVGWLAPNISNLYIAGPIYISPKQTIDPPKSNKLLLKHQKYIILG